MTSRCREEGAALSMMASPLYKRCALPATWAGSRRVRWRNYGMSSSGTAASGAAAQEGAHPVQCQAPDAGPGRRRTPPECMEVELTVQRVSRKRAVPQLLVGTPALFRRPWLR